MCPNLEKCRRSRKLAIRFHKSFCGYLFTACSESAKIAHERTYIFSDLGHGTSNSMSWMYSATQPPFSGRARSEGLLSGTDLGNASQGKGAVSSSQYEIEPALHSKVHPQLSAGHATFPKRPSLVCLCRYSGKWRDCATMQLDAPNEEEVSRGSPDLGRSRPSDPQDYSRDHEVQAGHSDNY